MEHEAALGVVKHAEVLVGLVERDHVVEAAWEVDICADAAIDLDEAHHTDLLHLLLGEGVLETVTELVGAGGWAWSPGATQLVKHPVLRGIEPLQVLFRSTSLHRTSLIRGALDRVVV